jgi:hypothetical protein
VQPTATNAPSSASELAEPPTHATPAIAAQDLHLTAPEAPKAPASSEILLHLTGTDQAAAAIRVADRGGVVNVSVHAPDATLRESLRSNLGELSAQLNQQGWKAEVNKPVAVAAQADSQQDSHAGDQRPPQQQQHASAGDQQQRGRRNPGGGWQQELEQQFSSGNALPGGNG